jgi:hypothetical protein
MNDWIPFDEGDYIVEQAWLINESDRAAVMEDTVVQIFADRQGRRHLRGYGRIRNVQVVELLEDSEDLDLLLDLGAEFKFLLKRPLLKSGKVFAPDIKSTFQFNPVAPWEELSVERFAELTGRLHLLPH